MMLLLEGTRMKKHATKMKGKTAFDVQAEQNRIENEKRLADVRSVYIAQQQLAEIAWQRKHSYTARRKKLENDWRENARLFVEDRTHPPTGIWKRGCERDDLRAYCAKRTGLVDVADIQHALWWYSLTDSQRFAIFLDSMPIIADDAAQERREKSRGNHGAD